MLSLPNISILQVQQSFFSLGWLEPLLHRIKQDDSVIAIPQHDNLNFETFKVRFVSQIIQGTVIFLTYN